MAKKNSKATTYEITEQDKIAIMNYCYEIVKENGFLYLNNFTEDENSSDEKKEFDKYLLKEKIKSNGKKKKIPQRVAKKVAEVLKTKFPKCKAKEYCVYDSERITIRIIRNLDQYIKTIKDIRKPIEYKKSEIFFRGQTDCEWGLVPFLYRNNKWVENENLMTEEMIRQYPDFLDDKRRIDTLTKLQHYEFPTRLLDITENPMVALYFACSDEDITTDGRIFYFSPKQEEIKYPNSDTVTILSNISKMKSSFGINSIKEDKVKNKFLGFIQDEKPNFKDLEEPDTINGYCFVKPHFNNERIRNQNGSFILAGVKNNKMDKPKIKDASLDNKMLIMINRTSKNALLEELNHIGINKGTIYPEMTKVASYVRTKYSV